MISKMKIQSCLKTLKHIVLLSLIVFTFIPCSVKGFLADNFQTSYSKPISNPKISNDLNTCFYSDLKTTKDQISYKKTVKIFNWLDNLSKTIYKKIETKFYSINPVNFSGNSPPKYILYKRLKIAITKIKN